MIAFKEVLMFIISTFGLSLAVFILLLLIETILEKIIIFIRRSRKKNCTVLREVHNYEQNRK